MHTMEASSTEAEKYGMWFVRSLELLQSCDQITVTAVENMPILWVLCYSWHTFLVGRAQQVLCEKDI